MGLSFGKMRSTSSQVQSSTTMPFLAWDRSALEMDFPASGLIRIAPLGSFPTVSYTVASPNFCIRRAEHFLGSSWRAWYTYSGTMENRL
jgi:hypothetical protein